MCNQERYTPERESLQHPPSDCFGLLKISGIDAKKFLQGQLTCNVDEVTETQSRLGAHCNPQGRVLFLFRLLYFQEAYYLILPPKMVMLALQALKKYAVFFKVTLSDASNEKLVGLRDRAVQEWNYFDLTQGIPQVYPETSGLFLPHELNLHQLQGISWDKGCYTGQEIIARMQYRGKLKKHLYLAPIQTAGLPHPGKEVYYRQTEGFRAAGLIVDCRQLGYNVYQLLILSSENNSSQALWLDPQQKIEE